MAGRKDTAVVETEAYLDLVEVEVSKAVSGLMAIEPTLDSPPLAKGLLNAQIERLRGVSKPNVEDLEAYRTALSKGDERFVKRDLESAKKVDNNTTARWKIAEKAKKDVADANVRADKAEAALRELQSKETMDDIRMACLSIGGLFLVAGMGLTVAGVWTGIQRLRASGFYSLTAGIGLTVTPIFLPTILMQPWFSYTAGGIILVLLGYLAYSVMKSKSCLTAAKTNQE